MNCDHAPICRHVVIHGHVQGVGYRFWTAQRALLLGVEGWVRNRRDGTVEALFIAPPHAVNMMLDACRRGPQAAEVRAIEERDGETADLARRRAGELFSMLPTL